MSRVIGVVSSSRADLGILRPVLEAIQREPALRPEVLATGMHLLKRCGLTVRELEQAGYPVRARVACLSAGDDPAAIAQAIGRGIDGFARLFRRWRPDILFVTGDRFEMYAAALAALPFKIPVAHVHGGELTHGAIDDALRHSVTKLSHLHFVSTEEYARRVMQLGEEAWRVTVSGAPSLDNVRTLALLDRQALQTRYGVRVDPAPLLVTFHPVTLEYEQAEWQAGELLAALQTFDRPVVFTLPNADTNGRVILRLIKAFVREHPQALLIENLGTQGYFSLMTYAAAMVGNSSSGLIEAPSLGLPVVNVGTRQQGRVRAENVIDVGCRRDEIIQGITAALAPAFRERLRGLANPYGNGHAAEVIVHRLRDIPLNGHLIQKRFVDAEVATHAP